MGLERAEDMSAGESKVVDLMDALERSVREAREARDRRRAEACPTCGGAPHDAYDCEAP